MKDIKDTAEAVVDVVTEVAEETSSLITPKRILAVGGVALLVGGSIWAYRTLKKRAAQIEVVEESAPEETTPEKPAARTAKP